MLRNDGTREDVRSSALWGTGNRGGESRSNALWGKGGRGLVMGLLAVSVLAFPFAATAGKGDKKQRPSKESSYISPDLQDKAKKQPEQKIPVIISSSYGSDSAEDAFKKVKGLNGELKKRLAIVGAVAVELKAKDLEKLSNVPGLTVTPDAVVRPTGGDSLYSSDEMWPHETGNSFFWGKQGNPPPPAPTIAIVDSGIDANRADFDFGRRVIQQVNLTTLPNNSAGDGRGHGTFVAGMAAGSAPHYAGASPTSKIVALDVMDDAGMARTSDVIAAAQWILRNKDQYAIKVANFSLHSTVPSNFTRDPLDKAVEKLWFAGVTVVVAAGNYGIPTGPSGVKYAPGNDPFVITVGAVDIGKGPSIKDDTAPPWSAYGFTYDGFMKPEIGAPGRYMVGPVPMTATLATQKADHIVEPGYIQLSGTSFAAPIVAGTAAQMLAAHPGWTPDQIKGVLMATARPTPKAPKFSTGVGEINASRAIQFSKTPPNPNVALNRFVVPDPAGGMIFNTVSWYDAATSNVSWDSISWYDVSWSDVSWNDVSWQDISWSDVSWQDVSWSDVMAVGDVSWEDAAEGDANSEDGLAITPEGMQEVLCDPLVNPNYDAAACLPPAPAPPAPTDPATAPVDPGTAPAPDPETAPAPAPAPDPGTAPTDSAPSGTGSVPDTGGAVPAAIP